MNKMYRKAFLKAMAAVAVTVLMFSCTKEEESSASAQVPQVIVDCDLGSSTDDLFALQMLYRYADQGRCRLLGVVVGQMGDTNAAIADVLNNYYGYPNLPIGLERNGAANPGVYINYCLLARLTNADGTPMFPRSRSSYDDLPDGHVLYRQLLASAPDHSVALVVTGFVSSVAHLLASGADQYSSPNGVELVHRKVKCLYFMGTKLTADAQQGVGAGYNLWCDLDAAETFFGRWPSDVDVVLSPSQVGYAIEYDSALVVSDISWTDIHPIKQTYLNVPCNVGQKMWDPLTAIQAVEGDGLFELSPRGRVVLHRDEGTVDFIADPDGNFRFQYAGSEAWNQQMLSLIRASN